MSSLVSIIIPAYNKAQLTVKTVESVLAQTYSNIEVIVIDDGSTDDTKERLSRFEDIKYTYKENGGACSARNLGIELAEGEYVGFLDCDDTYVPNKVELSVGILENDQDTGFVHTGAHFIDQNDEIVGYYSHPKSKRTGWIANRLIFGNYICNSTVIARKSCLEQIGKFDETIFMPADWDYWLRLAEKFKAGYIEHALTNYRVTDNYILKRLEKSKMEEMFVVEKYFERNPGHKETLYNKVLSNIYLRYAQCYFVQDDMDNFRKEFSACLKMNPLNVKALLMRVYYLVAKSHLKTKLSQKILRYGN